MNWKDARDLAVSTSSPQARFGGSHAQRDLLTLTLIEASLRAGDHRHARHYIGERLTHKHTVWSQWLLANCEQAGGALPGQITPNAVAADRLMMAA